MVWLYQYRIAGVVIQVDSDANVCEHDMQKFLCLYAQVSEQKADLIFRVSQQQKTLSFLLLLPDGRQETLWVSQDAAEISAALEIHLYSRLVQLLDSRDIVSIHASVLNVQDHAIMFAGESGAGKSSMCTAGLLDGAAYLSDEFTLLDAQGRVHPFPRPLQWEHPTHPAFNREEIEASGFLIADYLDFPAASGETARCHLWYPKHIQRKALPLMAVVLHQYRKDVNGVVIQEIPRHEALMELPKHVHIQHGLSKDLPRLNQRLSPLCKFYRLHFSDVKAAWAVIKEEVSGVV